MKVYLATAGEYSDYRVVHVFARREDAEAYKLGDAVEEREVRDGPVEVRYWYHLDWLADSPDRRAAFPFAANPRMDSELRDFGGGERNVTHTWHGTRLNVQGWDRDRVRKVYREQRGQYLAKRAGVT